jgi:hypothetical protein
MDFQYECHPRPFETLGPSMVCRLRAEVAILHRSAPSIFQLIVVEVVLLGAGSEDIE